MDPEAIVSFKCFLEHVQFWKIGEYHSEIPQLGYILLSDVFRPITSKEKKWGIKTYNMQSLLQQQYIICIHVIVAIYPIMGPYPYPGDLSSINRSVSTMVR